MTLGDKLRAAGLDVTLRWERPEPRRSRLYELLGLWWEKEALLGEPEFQRLGLWLQELPNYPEWHTLIEDLLVRDRAAFIPVKARDGIWECFGRFDRELHPDLYERLRELRWAGAAEWARRYGKTLPHLLEGDCFSIRGYNFRVSGVGNYSLRVSLLDQDGSATGGADLFEDVGVEPPVAVARHAC